jgi:DNA-binding GntR family transcriptional regulator
MINPEKPLLSRNIFKTIRDRIVYMDYPPGMNLSEKDLCKEFQVSRTPMREAFRRLEDMKLVSLIPRYGTCVSHINIDDIRCAYEVKITLEGLAGRLAAERITTDKLEELQTLIKDDGHRKLIVLDTNFHEIIYQSTQNPILEEMLENLQCRCARLWSSTIREKISRPEIVDELSEIYSSLKERDCEKTARLLESHVRNSIEVIKKQVL